MSRCPVTPLTLVEWVLSAVLCILFSSSGLNTGVLFIACLRSSGNEIVPVSTSDSSLANHAFQDLLVVATLDGHLHGVRKSTGEIAWTVRDSQGKVNVLPRPKATDKKLFLPDPRDGSLYFFDIDAGIRKLPMSIPEFVRAAPSRSADGLFYTGRKHASWIAINPVTGSKWELQGEGADDASCPLTDRNSILIPKIEYVLLLFDVNSRTNWNATYRHYGVWSRSEPELDPFDKTTDDGSFLLSSTNGGHLVKMNAVEKKLKWCSKFESPVVNVFSPSASSGNLVRYAFYSMPDEAMNYVLNRDFRRLNRLLAVPSSSAPATTPLDADPILPQTGNNEFSSRRTFTKIKDFLGPQPDSLVTSSVRIRERLSDNMALYIGHFNNEMYAMPSISDNVITTPAADGAETTNSASSASSILLNDGGSVRLPTGVDDVDYIDNEDYAGAERETGLINIRPEEPASCFIPAGQVREAYKYAQTPLIAGPTPSTTANADKKEQKLDVVSNNGRNAGSYCTTSFCPPMPQGQPASLSSSVQSSDAKPSASPSATAQPVSNTGKRDFYTQPIVESGDNASCVVDDSPLAAFLGLHVLPRQDELSTQVRTDSDFGGITSSSNTMDWNAIHSHRTPVIGKSPIGDQKVTSIRYWNSTSMLAAVILGLLIGILGVFAIVYFSPTKLFSTDAASSSSRKAEKSDVIANGDGSKGGSRHSGHSIERIVVGNKMEYYPNKLLGRGCDGTCVFKGRFDNRDVAVKRLLPDCFRLADREVAIMKHADTHPNVIRYYCTEADSQFRYIALELCQATLTDYVEGKTDFELDMKFVLLQAMNGLKHLHSLNIVHRDVKPRNVLLAYAAGDNNVVGLGVSHAGMHNVGDDVQRAIATSHTARRVRVLISDFGLCKQVTPGRVSITKHTGLIGTEGWIAPELVLAQRAGHTAHVHKSMDIFSAGCLFYYCLTNGGHPYGEELSRQVSIVQGIYSLRTLDQRGAAASAGGGSDQEAFLVAHLIEQMIQHDPALRPTAACVMSHPYFWTKARRLAFLQDVSDRIEKADTRSPIIRALENNHRLVVERDWMRLVGVELQRDLQVRRTYNRASVRDLLRAIRNKKHHYSELSEAVRAELGELTDAFLDYFTSRFPRLFMHVYVAMQLHAQLNAQDGGGLNIGAYYSPDCTWMALRVPAENWRDADNNADNDENVDTDAGGSPEKVGDENNADSPQHANGNLPLSSSPLRGGGSPSKNLRRPPFPAAANGFGLPKWHPNNKNSSVAPSNSFAVNNVAVPLAAGPNWQPTPTIVTDVDGIDAENEYVHEYFPGGNPNKTPSPRAEPRKVPSVLQKILDRHNPQPSPSPALASGYSAKSGAKHNAWQRMPASQPWKIISPPRPSHETSASPAPPKEETLETETAVTQSVVTDTLSVTVVPLDTPDVITDTSEAEKR